MEQPTAEQLRERRAALAAALRSGKYPQGKGKLAEGRGTDDACFCCMGVACEVAISLGIDLKATTGPQTAAYDGQTHVLPERVRAFAGFRTTNGDFYRPLGGSGCLTEMNDRGASFSEIADFIESNPPGLWEESK